MGILNKILNRPTTKRLVITQENRWFVVELGDKRFHMLNQQSLVYFLKHQVGFGQDGIMNLMHTFEYQSRIELEVGKDKARVIA